MNKEIEEILEALKPHEEPEFPLALTVKEQKLLLDYITNLQQIEQDHKEMNATLMQELTILQNRLDKAIEILKEIHKILPGTYNQLLIEITETINILQGSEYDE